MNNWMSPRKFREGAPEAVMRCCDAGERFKKERYTVILHYRVENHPLSRHRDRYNFLVIPQEGEPYLRQLKSVLGVIFGKTVPWLELPEYVRQHVLEHLKKNPAYSS